KSKDPILLILGVATGFPRPRCAPLGMTLELTDLRRPKIWLQYFWNPHRAIRLLIRFDQRCEQSRQRESRPIQGVAKAILPVRVLETQIHPARLEFLEV